LQPAYRATASQLILTSIEIDLPSREGLLLLSLVVVPILMTIH